MDKNKLIGAGVGIVIGILGALGVISAETVKAQICSTAPVEQVAK